METEWKWKIPHWMINTSYILLNFFQQTEIMGCWLPKAIYESFRVVISGFTEGSVRDFCSSFYPIPPRPAYGFYLEQYSKE